MIISYAISGTQTGTCSPSLLREEIRATDEFTGDPGLCIGATVHAGRGDGAEIEVEYRDPLTVDQAAAAAAAHAAHAASPTAAVSMMTSSDLTGEIPPGARCLILTAGGAAARSLPRVSEPSGLIIMHCSGPNDITITPHVADVGVTIDGGASITMGDGDAAVLAVDQGGQWRNLGPKAPA